ncbi:MAG: prolyl-tRNA synthetase associated domain-containing protein [Candidatus Dormibacteraeota bacterium]|nr:prolyl-tRNA synthetase associated domain-containing protein [Candidatus Dormibacteraeota bacterium]
MTDAPTREAAERQRLLDFLHELDIDAPVAPYPSHSTIEEVKRLRGSMAGTFTKNLLLKDKKGRLFFVTAFEDTVIDLKSLHTRVGARGRLGFAAAETLQDVLHVLPGAATPLALINDTQNEVTLVIDASLEGAQQLNFHPMVQTESIGLSSEQFATFITACGKDPIVVALD